MSYTVLILQRAQKELAKLPVVVYNQVKEAVKKLDNKPRPVNSCKLINREGWRIRVGNYRVIYEIDDIQKTITILHVGHRRDIYD